MTRTIIGQEALHLARTYFSDNSAAESFLELTRWPIGVACPDCDKSSVQRRQPGTGSYKCKACGRSWTVRQGTCMEGSKVPLGVWGAAVCLYRAGARGADFVDVLLQVTAISGKTAGALSQKLDERGAPCVANTLPARGETPAPFMPQESSPRATPSEAGRPKLLLPQLAAAAAGGAAIALLSVFAFGPDGTNPTSPTQTPPMGQYVGELPLPDGGTAHVTYILGTRVETPIPDEESRKSALDRHLRNVERVRITPSESTE